MKITRDVVCDLLPAYFAGKVSTDTRALVEAFFKSDPPRGNFGARHDLVGRYGLPGFVDAHAHITAGPHEVALVNGGPVVTIESVDDVTQFSARMALAFGVTTVRNPAGDPTRCPAAPLPLRHRYGRSAMKVRSSRTISGTLERKK